MESYGITAKTLLKAYDVMLLPEDRNSETAKFTIQKQLVLLYEQWKLLIEGLDKYYMWSKKYRDVTRNFNLFVYDYVAWMELHISGERFPAYLQIKDKHEIYAQYRAWYYDTNTIRLKVGRGSVNYLVKKNEKYMKEKNI